MTGAGQPFDLDCYIRAGRRPKSITTLVARLREVASAGAVAELTVHPWPCTVDLDAAENDRILDSYERFDQWATNQDAQIHPPFTVRRVDSTITGETRHELVTPVLCLALSTSHDLAGVFPHTVAGTTYTAHDVVATLEAGDALATLSPAVQTHRGRTDEDPEDNSPVADDVLGVPHHS